MAEDPTLTPGETVLQNAYLVEVHDLNAKSWSEMFKYQFGHFDTFEQAQEKAQSLAVGQELPVGEEIEEGWAVSIVLWRNVERADRTRYTQRVVLGQDTL